MTVCVGEKYTRCLAESLHIWAGTLESLTIITTPSSNKLYLEDLLSTYSKLVTEKIKVHTTDVFTAYGAYFNKGAAQCAGYLAMNPTEWALSFDADIVPPRNWREIAESKGLEIGNLYGSRRFKYHVDGLDDMDSIDSIDSIDSLKCLESLYNVETLESLSRKYDAQNLLQSMDKLPIYPFGYFQLWHTHDIRSWQWPIFSTRYKHAGIYDEEFADHWPTHKRIDLEIYLGHIGDSGYNWYGPGADPKHMGMIRSMGFDVFNRESRAGRIDVLELPEPLVKVKIPYNSNPEWARKFILDCASIGPFGIEVKVDYLSDYITANSHMMQSYTTEEVIKELIIRKMILELK